MESVFSQKKLNKDVKHKIKIIVNIKLLHKKSDPKLNKTILNEWPKSP